MQSSRHLWAAVAAAVVVVSAGSWAAVEAAGRADAAADQRPEQGTQLAADGAPPVGASASADAVVDDAAARLAVVGTLDGYTPPPVDGVTVAVASDGRHLAVAVDDGSLCAAAAIRDGQPLAAQIDRSGDACRPGAVDGAVAWFAGDQPEPTVVEAEQQAPSLPSAEGDRRLLRVADAARFAAQMDWEDGRPSLARFTIAALDDPDLAVVVAEPSSDGRRLRLTVDTDGGCRAMVVEADGGQIGPSGC